MAGNQSIPDLPVVPDPAGGSVYIAKNDTDYRVEAGGAGGLATLGSDGKLSSGQVPPVSVTVTWASISGKPTTLAGYGITDAVASSAFTWANLGSKPSTFAPSAHDASLITSGTLASARLTGAYTDFTSITTSGNITSGNRVLADRGLQTAPAFSFTADTNTGMWSSAENTIDFSCGSVVRLEIGATGIGVTGSITATGNITAYSSDKRLKTNIKNISYPMDKLFRIGGYTFNWDLKKCEEVGFHPDNVVEHGVIAQEVQKVMPDAVQPAAFDPDYLTVNYARIVPLLIECIKDLQNQIDRLKE